MDRLPPFDKIGVTPVPDHVNADPANSVQGSILNVLIFNQLQREGVNLLAAGGLTPDTTVLSQWAQALARGVWAGSLTGTGDLAVATLPIVFPALLQGMRVGGVATATNTVTNPKLRVANLGTTGGYTDFPILREDGSALAVGDIKAGRRYRYEADGAGNVLISGGGLGAGSGGGFLGLDIITTSGTWTPSSGMGRGLAIVTGGGAGGAGGYNHTTGGGGGAGATAFKFFTVTGALAATIGAAGAAGVGSSSGNLNGTAGGTTSLGSIASASGGLPTNDLDSNAYTRGGLGGFGGSTGVGDDVVRGGDGETAIMNSQTTGSGIGVNGGSSFWGGGGSGNNPNPAPGSHYQNGRDGQAWGSGGGGGGADTGSYTANGGAGKQGVIYILKFA